MQRITSADMQSVIRQYQHAIEMVTGELPELSYQEGSKTYGNSFRLHHIGRDKDGQETGPTSCWGTYDGFLGWTKREAYETLSTIASTIYDVRYFQRENESQ